MKTKIPDRRPALPGEIFFVKDRTMARLLIGADQGSCEVLQKSEGGNGQWLCISCGVALANNFEKDSHCETSRRGKSALIGNPPVGTPDAKHVLAWRSFDSGKVEAP